MTPERPEYKLRGISPDALADLKNRTQYHPAPKREVAAAHEEVRLITYSSMQDFTVLCRPGRELSLALTKLEEAMFWANASIARIDEDGVRL
jgi:hypothetical protein